MGRMLSAMIVCRVTVVNTVRKQRPPTVLRRVVCQLCHHSRYAGKCNTVDSFRSLLLSFHPDDQCDSEVAYADIVITVRGASSPELAQICYGSHEDQREVE